MKWVKHNKLNMEIKKHDTVDIIVSFFLFLKTNGVLNITNLHLTLGTDPD